MYKTDWKTKYNEHREKEMTPEEVLDMWEWQHNLTEDMMINRNRRRKYRKPFKMTLEEAKEALERWNQPAAEANSKGENHE